MYTLKTMFRYKVYSKMILSYVLLITVTISFVCSLLFYLFSSNATREIDNNSRALLSQISYASDVVYNQVMSVGNQLINDPNVNSFLSLKEDDKVINYTITRQLSLIQGVYPFIKSIGIIKPQSDILLDTMRIPADKDLFEKYPNKYISFYPKRVSVNGSNSNQPYNLITFVLFPDFSLNAPSKGAICINIDEGYILNTISNISRAGYNENTFVVDAKGLVLSHKDSGMFMADLSGEDYIIKIVSENKNEGSFIQYINNQKQLVTYVKSSNLNWYFISVRPYNQIIRNISQLRNITLLIAVFLILIGIIISLYLTGNIYNPMKSLIEKAGRLSGNTPMASRKMDEYKFLLESFSKSEENEKSMKSSIHKSSQVVKENYLCNLIRGNLKMATVPDELAAFIESGFSGPYFCVIVFKIDRFTNFKERNDQKNQALLRFALSNIAQELLDQVTPCDAIITEEDEVVIIAQLSKDETDEELFLPLSQIQAAYKEYFQYSVTASLGHIVYTKSDLHLSYASARENAKYRLFYGYEKVLDSYRTKQHFSNTEKYPHSLEKKIIEAIQLRKPASIKKRVDEFVYSGQNATYYQEINYCNQLVISLFNHFEKSIDLFKVSFNEYYDSIHLINNAETMEEISQIIQDFCTKICELLDKKSTDTSTQKYKLIIEEVQKYTHEHYSNPGLSIELVSEIVNLSPGYLGKLFKSNTTMSFNEYLNTVRLEKAKEMLTQTTEPASKISEAVGIYNVTYFSTLFKKTYGVTPSLYRDKH